MSKCSNCGNEDWLLVKNTSLMVVKRCNGCGREQTTLISPSDDPEIQADLEPVFTIMARWPGVPTLHEINELRAHFRLMPESAEDVLRKARNHEQFDLGRFNESEMRSHAPLLERLGLELERIPVARSR